MRNKLLQDQGRGDFNRSYNMASGFRDERGGNREVHNYEAKPRCYNCNQEDHQRFNFPNPPPLSKDTGHMALKRPKFKINRGLRLCSYGMLGRLFYGIHVPLEEEDVEHMPLVGPAFRLYNSFFL